jgi:hypothetical protein
MNAGDATDKSEMDVAQDHPTAKDNGEFHNRDSVMI